MPEAPDPVPSGYLRSLIEGAQVTQGDAARLLHVPATTLRRWLTDGASHRDPPWAAAELLRLRLKLSKKKGCGWTSAHHTGGLGAHPIQCHDCNQPAAPGDDADCIPSEYWKDLRKILDLGPMISERNRILAAIEQISSMRAQIDNREAEIARISAERDKALADLAAALGEK